jgi:hypothetical protein
MGIRRESIRRHLARIIHEGNKGRTDLRTVHTESTEWFIHWHYRAAGIQSAQRNNSVTSLWPLWAFAVISVRNSLPSCPSEKFMNHPGWGRGGESKIIATLDKPLN